MTKKTQGRARGAGSIQWRSGHRWVRVSLPDDTRPWYRLCGEVCNCHDVTDARAKETAAAVAERERARVAAELSEQRAVEQAQRVTVQQFGEQWTSGELYRKHGRINGLRPKASANEDKYRLRAYVYPEIGSKLIADVTEQDVERVMAKAPPEWRAATRLQLYQVMRRLFDLAIVPGRFRKDSPVSHYTKPSLADEDELLFQYLYPSEVLAILRNTEIAVGRRVLYALAAYTGLRKSTLYALTWASFDDEHGTLTYFARQNKTRVARIFVLEFGLREILRAWRDLSGEPGGEAKIVQRIKMEKRREPAQLRADLQASGVKRALLFSQTEGNEPIRFHDLRATFCTWAKRAGKSDGWITDRAGWVEPEMMARYDRQARTLADLQIVPFPDLSEAIPELAKPSGNVVRLPVQR
jgi:integrase